jgi:DNA repair exonuclease SbcCD nuclease subunit
MKIKIAHLADLHIGSYQYGITKRKLNTYKNNLKIAKEISLNHNLVIVAGDVFDSVEPSPDDVKCWIDMCRIWGDTNCRVISCSGNHDKVVGQHQWVDLGNEEGFKSESIFDEATSKYLVDEKLSPLKIVWLSHTKKSEIKNKIDRIPDGLDIIMMHQSAGHFLASIMRPELDEDDIMSLSKKCKYLALGDLHIHKKMKIGDCTVCYPGNIDFLRLCDMPNNFRYISLVYNSETSSFESIESIPYTPYQKTNILNFDSGSDCIQKITGSDDFNIFRYDTEKSSDVVSVIDKIKSSDSLADSVYYFHKNISKKERGDSEKVEADETCCFDNDAQFLNLAKKDKTLEIRDFKIVEDIWTNSTPDFVKQILMSDLKKELDESIKSNSE